MTPRITTDVPEAVLHCRYKGHLRKNRPHPGGRPNRTLRVHQRVRLIDRPCPACGRPDVGSPKRSFDNQSQKLINVVRSLRSLRERNLLE